MPLSLQQASVSPSGQVDLQNCFWTFCASWLDLLCLVTVPTFFSVFHPLCLPSLSCVSMFVYPHLSFKLACYFFFYFVSPSLMCILFSFASRALLISNCVPSLCSLRIYIISCYLSERVFVFLCVSQVVCVQCFSGSPIFPSLAFLCSSSFQFGFLILYCFE